MNQEICPAQSLPNDAKVSTDKPLVAVGQYIMKTPEERIKSMIIVEPNTKCWEWQGALKSKEPLRQYGRLTIGSRKDGTQKNISAHRYSYMVFNGIIHSGLWVLHKCDNPKCVNPEHLFLGTRQDNVDDRERKGRNKPPTGEKNWNTTLTNEKVANIKYDYLVLKHKRRDVSKKYNVSISTLKSIKWGSTWKDIIPSLASSPINNK